LSNETQCSSLGSLITFINNIQFHLVLMLVKIFVCFPFLMFSIKLDLFENFHSIILVQS